MLRDMVDLYCVSNNSKLCSLFKIQTKSLSLWTKQFYINTRAKVDFVAESFYTSLFSITLYLPRTATFERLDTDLTQRWKAFTWKVSAITENNLIPVIAVNVYTAGQQLILLALMELIFDNCAHCWMNTLSKGALSVSIYIQVFCAIVI